MSAFFVGVDHVNALVTFAATLDYSVILPSAKRLNGRELWQEDLTHIGRALIAENCNSLAARYPSDWQDMLPDDFTLEKYTFDQDMAFLDKYGRNIGFAVLHGIACYEYQSCEHIGWEQSWARKFCRDLSDAAVRSLPNYNTVVGMWGYQRRRRCT